jgi:hypothetical protein
MDDEYDFEDILRGMSNRRTALNHRESLTQARHQMAQPPDPTHDPPAGATQPDPPERQLAKPDPGPGATSLDEVEVGIEEWPDDQVGADEDSAKYLCTPSSSGF